MRAQSLKKKSSKALLQMINKKTPPSSLLKTKMVHRNTKKRKSFCLLTITLLL